jgi:two-component system, OmpR family, sensor histidine kinase KdpD
MKKGRLKIFLGYAAGVGKTYQMLDEAQNLKAQGTDIVIGYFEPHGRQDTIAKTEGLETIPRRRVEYRGTAFEEMNLPAILERRPQVCVVDEFPHSNVPGLEHEKRWQDVQTLLEAGIDVLTTMNIQHLESLNDQMQQITGVKVRETIPDWILKQADEVVMVDVTPRALLNRLERGVVYSAEKARAALENFFREPTLLALREIALRQTAHEVDIRQPDAPTGEKILIHVTSHPHTAALIRRARRIADFLQAECLAVAIRGKDAETLDRHLTFARSLQIAVEVLDAEEVAPAVVDYARQRGVTQIYLSSPDEQMSLWRRSIAQQVVRLARDMRVVIVSSRPQLKMGS